MSRYNVKLAPALDKDFNDVCEKLGITRAEAMRRALTLFKHAVNADEVKLVKDQKETSVLIK